MGLDKATFSSSRGNQALTSTETINHYDQQLPLSSACDTSSVGVGAVIFHTLLNGQEKPIAYASRKLTHTERNYAQIQKEALAIIYGVQKFRQYLIGHQFYLITDHKPLLSIFHPAKGVPEMVASHLQRWAITLSSYNYEVNFQKSEKQEMLMLFLGCCLTLTKANHFTKNVWN